MSSVNLTQEKNRDTLKVSTEQNERKENLWVTKPYLAENVFHMRRLC